MATCHLCNHKILSPACAYRKVEGYEQSRAAGGTNALTLRKPLDQYACTACISRLKSGISTAQGSLLG
jgi:hypothetical protein